MELRDARVSDADSLAEIAQSSLRESYGHFVDEETIDELTGELYEEDLMSRQLDEEGTILTVVEEEDEPVGFVQAELVEEDAVVGEIDWLHVHPDAREQGIGVRLLGQVQEAMETNSAAALRGLVLADNEEGTAFYEDHGFERVEEREVEIGEESFSEIVYQKPLGDDAEEIVEPIEGPEGELFVNYTEGTRGTIAPLYAVYSDDGLADRYGWYCSNCESLATAMGSMGRIKCQDCENERTAQRWDGSYL